MNMNKYEKNLIFIMQMHYQEIKYNFKNYMNNSYKYQKNKGSSTDYQIYKLFAREK